MPKNVEIWDALKTTDPAATSAFNNGSFKGTAIKPIWMVKRMTEQFGPCGQGWGIKKPEFQVEHCESETLVYCTVSVWHGVRENEIWGVGGDKVRTVVKRGKPDEYIKTDDEAFKKAYTDAVSNCLKYLGVGADVHMGLFDDSKYIEKASAAEQKRRWAAIESEIQNELLDARSKDDARKIFNDYWRKMQAEGLGSEDWKAVLTNSFAPRLEELERQEAQDLENAKVVNA